MLKKSICLLLFSFIAIGCSETKEEKSVQVNPKIDSVDLLGKVISSNNLGFERVEENQFSISTNQSIADYTLENGKISEIVINESNAYNSSNNNFKAQKKNAINTKFSNQIKSTFTYDGGGTLISASTNGQEFKNSSSITDSEVIKRLSVDGKVGMTISLSSNLIKKEFANGSYLISNRINDKIMDIESDGKKIASLELDSLGNVVKEEIGNDEKTFDYDEYGNIVNVKQNYFSYSVCSKDDCNTTCVNYGDLSFSSNFMTDGITKNSIFGDDEYSVCSDETKNEILINGKNINYINNLRTNKYEQVYTESIEIDGEKILSYECDNLGNIVSEISKNETNEYSYDYLGQLINWNNNGNLTFYNYDKRGNILDEKCGSNENVFSYGEEDVLLKFNDKALAYDDMYNIISFGDDNFSYERGNVLNKFSNNDFVISYKYDSNNIRKASIINGEEHRYYYVDTKLIMEDDGKNQILYLYDSDDNAIGFNFCGSNYFYIRDAKQCIKYVTDSRGEILVEYSYDPWGNILSIKDSSSQNLSSINRIVYKGYYFDFETNLYYLMSRYYSPVLKRFITRDSLERIATSGTSDVNLNLFSYANNNPIMKADPMGYEAIVICGVAISATLIYAIVAVVLVISVSVLVYMLIDAIIDSGVPRKISDALNNVRKQLENTFKEVASAAKKAITTWLLVYWKWWDNTYRGQYEEHHIIAQSAASHALPRQWLRNYGSTVNDSRNLVSIKKIFHKHLHTTVYYNTVTLSLTPFQYGKSDQFFGVLAGIKACLTIFSNSLPS